MKNIFTLLLLAVTTWSFAQDSALLRLTYNKGDKYVMQMDMKQNMGEGAMIMDMYIEMPMEVIDVNDGIYHTEMRFKNIKMNMEQSGMKINYDSNLKEEDLDEKAKMMSTQMKPMLETVLAAKTNVYGEVLEMKMVKGSGNADQFTSQTQSITYPKEAVSVGYSWNVEKDNNGMKMNTTYTVKSINDKEVIIDVKGDITGASSGSLTGVMNIDKASGVPALSNISMNFDVMGQKVVTEIVMKMKKAA